jgi:hypothetical protein
MLVECCAICMHVTPFGLAYRFVSKRVNVERNRNSTSTHSLPIIHKKWTCMRGTVMLSIHILRILILYIAHKLHTHVD